MTVTQILPVALTVVGLSLASTLVLIVAVKMHRGRSIARSTSLLTSYRSALIAIASGEDEDGQAKAALYAVPPTTWARLRPTVLAFLPKVRGASADDLSDLMRFHGEIDRATEMLTSRSAVMTRQGFHDDSPAVAALSHDVNAPAGGDVGAHAMSGDV